MTKQKHRISLSDIKVRTDAEILEDTRKYELRKKLGLLLDYDDSYRIREYKKKEEAFLKISSEYTSLNDYENDKSEASIMITFNKEIPQDLYNRLLITKQELEQAGLL